MPRRSSRYEKAMSLANAKPDWIKVRAFHGDQPDRIRGILRRLDLHTVCSSARCPNAGECWSRGAATFMLLGNTCTRGCRFCAVPSGRVGEALDPREPEKIADAVRQLGLSYVVLTMVTRDDLPDGGAAHVAQAVRAVRAQNPAALVETLVGDFGGDARRVAALVRDAEPEVFAHNVEVTLRLQRAMRDARCSWEGSLSVLREAARAGARVLKSSLMVGCGETDAETAEAMQQFRECRREDLNCGAIPAAWS